MRYVSFGTSAAIALAAAASLVGHAFPVSAAPEPREAPLLRQPHRLPRYRSWRGRTKRLAAGRYKGSRWAKRAHRRGGNPARF